jgi:AcrR family transcriptional regulator
MMPRRPDPAAAPATAPATARRLDRSAVRSERLSRERIVAEAIALADRDGIDGLSMRRLAAALEVDPMSLYHHLRDKEALLDAVGDALVAQIEVPEPQGEWPDQLRALILAARATMLRHPWSARVLDSRDQAGPATVAYIDRVLGILRAGGVSLELAHHAVHALGSRVLGFDANLFDDAPTETDPALVAAQVRAWAPTLPHVAELALAAAHDGVLGACDDDAEFLFALDLILDGLQRRAAAT